MASKISILYKPCLCSLCWEKFTEETYLQGTFTRQNGQARLVAAPDAPFELPGGRSAQELLLGDAPPDLPQDVLLEVRGAFQPPDR